MFYNIIIFSCNATKVCNLCDATTVHFCMCGKSNNVESIRFLFFRTIRRSDAMQACVTDFPVTVLEAPLTAAEMAGFEVLQGITFIVTYMMNCIVHV